MHELAEEAGALDVYNVANILRSFSRSQENQMSGSEKLFIHLEPFVLQNLDQFSARDLSHVLYAYGVRSVGNPELYKAFEQRLLQLIAAGEVFDYPTLFNVIYFMLFQENSNETIWRAIVDHTVENDDTLPLTYYKPFKFSRFFLEAKFPEWDLADYVDRFWYAERYFNQVQLDDLATSDHSYQELKAFLNQKCLVYPIVFMTQHNLFNLHYVFYEQKIAINYHLDKMCPPFTKRPSELQKMASKLLKYQDWEILDLSEQEFRNWQTQEKIDNLKGWLREAKQRQIEKGVCKEYSPPI